MPIYTFFWKIAKQTLFIFVSVYLFLNLATLEAAARESNIWETESISFVRETKFSSNDYEDSGEEQGVFEDDLRYSEVAGNVSDPPITVFADYIHYDHVTGELFAEGSVRVVQLDQVLFADRIDGNANTGDIWTETTTRFVETSTNSDLVGDASEYNYETKTGHIYNVRGKSGSQFITADTVEILPEKMVGQNALMTRCRAQAHAKCQHITATRVDIWPNDKLIAYNASVYILGKRIYSQKRYVVTFGGQSREIPQLGYSSKHGWYIKQTFSYPVTNKTIAGADLYASTKDGGRSKGWLRHNETNFAALYSYGFFEDDDNNWIKKEHNLELYYHPKQLFKTPLNYRFWFERGHWKDKRIESWHTEAGAYLWHNPIYLGSKSLYLTLGTGYRKLKESYNNVESDEYRYDIGLYKTWSRKLSTGVSYADVTNNVRVFEYNAINVSKSLTYMATYSPDRLNSISFLQEYDLDNQRVYRNRLTYVRNLHCWQIVMYYERERFTYKPYENKFHWEIHLAI